MNYYYQQLAGALGVLKSAGIDLDYATLVRELREIAREHGPDRNTKGGTP